MFRSGSVKISLCLGQDRAESVVTFVGHCLGSLSGVTVWVLVWLMEGVQLVLRLELELELELLQPLRALFEGIEV